jgi:hypothetical protein
MEHVEAVSLRLEGIEAVEDYVLKWLNPGGKRGRCYCDGCRSCKRDDRMQWCTKDSEHLDHGPFMTGHELQTQVTILYSVRSLCRPNFESICCDAGTL